MDLSSRSTLPEEMDEPDLDEATYRGALTDLAALNRLTFTHRAALRWLRRASRGLPGFSVLDVACGHGDLLRAIAGRGSGAGISLSGIDLNPRAIAAAKAATPAAMRIDYQVGDVFAWAPVPPPDFVLTSQFTHHLTEAELVRLLRWLEKTAVKGWMITDLHRHFLPYLGFRALAAAMRWHRIVRQDGTISIARGFRRREWLALLRQAGVEASVHWRFPFRHTVSHLK